MAMIYATITGTITRPGSNVGVRARITATPLTTNQALTFTGDDRITIGPETAETNGSGTLSTLKIPTNVDVGALLWRITAEALDRGPGPSRWTVKNAVAITGSSTIKLKDLVEVDVITVDAAIVTNVSALVADADSSKTAAAGSATAAAGSASAAATSASAAAGSATGASGSASAAATSASTASTKAGEASGSATAAAGSASAAAASASHADAMAGAAEAVAVSNDTIIAGRINDSASATAAALTASYVGKTTDAPAVDIRWIGCVADEASATCSIISGTNVLTRSSGSWSPSDVGKVLSVPGAQATPDALGRTNMPAKITGFTNPTTVTLDRTATATASGVTVVYATDNTATWQAAITAAAAGFIAPHWFVPSIGKPFYVNMLLLKSNTRLEGPGEVKQVPRNWTDAGTSTSNGGTIMPWNGGRGTSTPTENVQIVGLHINGNKGAHYGSVANRTNGEGINFKYGRNCLAFGNTIWDTNGDGIDFDECQNSKAISNHITDASTCGIHSSNDNIGNVIAFNNVTHCGWDLYADSGVSVGGIDGAGINGNKEITYIGNVVDGCRINYAIGDPNTIATDRFVAIGNRSRAVAATPGLPDILHAYIGDVTAGTAYVGGNFTFGGTTTLNGSVIVNNAVQAFISSATASAYTARATGDTQPRFTARANGTLLWGTGAAAQDTSLGRAAADRLDMGAGDSFKLDGTWNGGRLMLGAYNLWVDASGRLRVLGSTPTADTDGQEVGGPISGTSANFNSVTNSRNTIGKYAGRPGWSTTANRPIWAVGPNAADVWVYADGTTAYTPV